MDAIVTQVELQKSKRPRSRSVDIARRGPVREAVPVRGYEAVRRALRDPGLRQAGFKADLVERAGRTVRPPILFLSGEAHRRQRAATARFFTPRAVKERHRPVIEACCDRLIGELQRSGHGRLDTMALDLAVTVAGGIVGLTDSDKRGMIKRLDAFFSPVLATRHDPISGAIATVLGQIRMFHFHIRDVRPAIAARRRQPREDVISHLLSEGYSDRDILVECFTYGAAGMVTTREFVTMAGWHLLENGDLRERFLATDRLGRLAMLEEILRLEPVVGTLYRRAEGDKPPLALDIRSANADPEAMGDDPQLIDPDRRRSDRVGGAGLAFGDGEHRCPGAGVALNEAEAFLDRLLRVPGLRLTHSPRLGWNPLVTGYELRDCLIEIA